MKQIVMTYSYKHNVAEISKCISEALSKEPTWSVQTMSVSSYITSSGISFDAIVVYNISGSQDILSTPKLQGDVWDNGYRLPFNTDPILCATDKE